MKTNTNFNNFVILAKRIKLCQPPLGPIAPPPLLTFEVPPAVSLQDVAGYWETVTTALELSGKVRKGLACELELLVAVKPYKPKLTMLLKDVRWKLAGFATWKPLEDETPVEFGDGPDAIYTMPHKGTHPTWSDALATCLDTVVETAHAEGDVVEPVVWLTYGEL